MDQPSTPYTVTRRDFLAAAAAAWAAASGLPGLSLRSVRGDVAPDSFAAGWEMQASKVALDGGDKISQPDYQPSKWYGVSIPSTVLAGLVASGEYPDLFFGENLKQVPADRFKTSWWYRKEFTLTAEQAAAQAWIYFKGINYRANIWLNGKQIADGKTAVGAYRDLEFPITSAALLGRNVLAVEIFPPKSSDLTITFVDWAPHPPDANMGIWQDVELRFSNPVALRNPHILTDLDIKTLASAQLTVMADVINPTSNPVSGELRGKIGDVEFAQDVTLAANETKTVTFDATSFPQLAVKNPRVWWPWQLGSPELYKLQLTFSVNGAESDKLATNFGIRQVTSRLLNGHTLFTVNGVDLLILGGGYAPDLLQRRVMPDRPSWQEDHIRYVRDMNLNAVRLEGKLEDDAFFDLCDKYGILVMAGWCCCSAWEQWKKWKDEQVSVAMDSLRYQIRRLRTHPSLLVWLNGSDNHPTPEIEAKYLAIEKELNWPCPTLASAAAAKAASGPTGVKMEGPYKWEPPIYWYTDKTKGGAYGFNTEVGPGAVPPPLESLQKMLPKEHQWPIDDFWSFHCGANEFANIKDFTDAMDARFGKSASLADFSWKAQAQAYETIKAMYEAFRRNKFESTGEIQWMLNNAWPSMIWHLYDYYFRPGGAYFGVKQACEPVHVLYSYDDHAIVVANDTLHGVNGAKVTAEVYDINLKLKHQKTETCNAAANKATVVFKLPDIPDISTTYFLRLTLTNSGGDIVNTNSYWLSTKPDVLSSKEGAEDDWNITRCDSYCDYTALQGLPKAEFSLEAVGHAPGDEEIHVMRVTNISSVPAILVRLKATKGQDGDEILPIRWSDNYFMLMPNEKREITAKYMSTDAGGASPVMTVDCFNNGRG